MYEGLAASFARRLPSVALLRRAARGKLFGFPLKSQKIVLSAQNNFREPNNSRKQNDAFSGYARGKFLAIPCGHCSFPPRLRRLVHENLAVLRFSVSLWFYKINNSATQFAKTFAYAGKVNAARIKMVCSEKAHRRGKLRLYRARRGQWGFPENHENLF